MLEVIDWANKLYRKIGIDWSNYDSRGHEYDKKVPELHFPEGIEVLSREAAVRKVDPYPADFYIKRYDVCHTKYSEIWQIDVVGEYGRISNVPKNFTMNMYLIDSEGHSKYIAQRVITK